MARVGPFFMPAKVNVLDKEGIRKALVRIAHELLERHRQADRVCLVGIRSRGELLARRLAALLQEMAGVSVPVGALDITFYRDDLTKIAHAPIAQLKSLATQPDGLHIVDVVKRIFNLKE